MEPDVMVVQETESQIGVDLFLDEVLNYYQSNTYSSVPFNDGPYSDNGFFYKRDKLIFLGADYITTTFRDIAEYTVTFAGTGDTVRIYSLHFKDGETDTIRRLSDATVLRNYLSNFPDGSKFIVAGDFNIYRSTEPAFQKLIRDEANNNGRSKDPLNAVGRWHNNPNFRFIHTQSPRTRSFGGGTRGGTDDRYDMLLTSYTLERNLLASTYTSYGNDGNHFNDSINRMPNSAVPNNVANALHYASDHLPVYADFVFGIPRSDKTDSDVPTAFDLYQNWPNPFNASTTIQFALPRASFASLKIFNVLGEEVATLVSGEQDAGTHSLSWLASGISSGVYFYRLTSGDFIDTKKLLLLK
jgi:exonuclease III